jgi:hypothetical protein
VIGSDPCEIASVQNVGCLIHVSLSPCSYSLRVTFCFPACHLLRLPEHHGFNKSSTVLGWEGVGDGGHSAGFFPHLCDT